MKLRRSGLVLATGCIALFLAMASTAYACFMAGTDPYAEVLNNKAPAGTVVTVRGANWAADELTVHWGSRTGPLVARDEGSPTNGSFSVSFIVPEASPGLHYLHVVQAGERPAGYAVALEVVTPVVAAPGDPARPAITAGSTTGGAAPAPTTSTGTAAPVAGQSWSGLPVPALATDASPEGNGTAAPVAGRAPAATGAGRTPAQGGSLSAVLPSSAPATPAAEEQAAPVPSPRSASGDLWPGFTGGDSSRTPSLVNPNGVDEPSSQPMLGLGLVMAGLVAIAGGFGVAELGRRRATVGSARTR